MHNLRSYLLMSLWGRWGACLIGGALGLVGLMMTTSSFAQSNPIVSVSNECTGAGGLGKECSGDSECSDNQFAKTCIIPEGVTKGTCFVGCDQGEMGETQDRDPTRCSFGEQCIEHGGSRNYCLPVPFQMDLNLLDQCITYWLEGSEPAWSNNRCSLEANLNRLLDQDQNYQFDIFDLDLCILAFLDRPGPPDELAFELSCDEDNDCGQGLYCDPELNTCTRECGVIPSREESINDLDRQCVGALKTCDYERGRCETLTIESINNLTCEVDRNCPSGAYCFLGQCAPHCYRSIDCPSSEWYCTDVNKCRVLPSPETNESSFVFDPNLYAIRFARKQLDLNGVETRDEAPLAIMDLITRQQVIGNPAVSFGYRLIVDYKVKEDARCLAPFPEDCETGRDPSVDATPEACYERVDDCIVDSATESWIRLVSPFGTVSATGDPSLQIELDEAIVERLSPGKYRATIKAVYDNGDSDELTVIYHKQSPSGQYVGSYRVHYQNERYSLSGLTPINLGFDIHLSDEITSWDALLTSQNLTADIQDIASGQKIYAYLDGASSLSFANADVQRTDHKIPFMGIYYPERGLMRLVGRSVIAGDYTETESTAETDGITAQNLFNRDIERTIEFFGSFNEKTGFFSGTYSEMIKGMTPTEITLRGSFSLRQIIADSTGLDASARATFALSNLAAVGGVSAAFDDIDAIRAALDAEINTHCDGDNESHFQSSTTFNTYLETRTSTPIYSNLITFSDLIGEALGSLGTQANAPASYLSVYDFLRDRIEICPADRDASPEEFQGYNAYEGGDTALCVSEPHARCGLALYQRALLGTTADPDAWVQTAEFATNVSTLFGISSEESSACQSDNDCEVEFECYRASLGDEMGVCRRPADPSLPLFCDQSIDISGCEVDLDNNNTIDNVEKVHFTLKEHNRFWLHLVQALKFQGDSYLSDAFMTLYRNQENPFTEGAATVYKRENQADALAKFDQIIKLLTSAPMMQILYNWPIDAYLQRGNDWLNLMQVVAADRIETLAAMVDLDRRIFLKRNLSPKFDILQNIMQQEYLFQAYLLHLQIKWQEQYGFLVNYEGRSENLFREGQKIINQVNITRNELGLFDKQVYFESTRTQGDERSNWRHYLFVLTGDDGGGGLLNEAQTMVSEAVDEMKASLSDLDTLEEKIFAARREISGYVAEQCGASASEMNTMLRQSFRDAGGNIRSLVDQNADGKHDYCDYLLMRYNDKDLIKNIRDCKLYNDDENRRTEACKALGIESDSELSFTYSCDEDGPNGATQAAEDYGTAGYGCKEVVKSFAANTDLIIDGGSTDPLTAPPRCVLNRFSDYQVQLGGKTRMCVGGQMGALAQEKRLLEFQREQVIGSMETLAKRFTQKYGMGAELYRQCRSSRVATGDEPGEYCGSPRVAFFAAQQIFAALEVAYKIRTDAGEAAAKILEGLQDSIKCNIIGGFAVGTDCPQSIAGWAAKVGASTALFTYLVAEASFFHIEKAVRKMAGEIMEAQADQAEVRHEIMEMVREVDDLITEFQTLTMQIFNAHLAIEDLRYQIGANYATYQDDVRFITDHLVGRQQGNLLRGRRLAIKSDTKFREVLQYSYRMYMAFLHQYNISPDDAAGMRSRLLNSSTLDDVERFIDELTQYELEYCGREGIDCDTLNNIEVLRFSVRDRLFPGLRDIVDARTGKVLSAGEQFNNIITSPPYYKQAVLNQRPIEMIELLFSTPLTMQEFGPQGPSWMINPLECNHLLATNSSGNIAVNVIGKNLGDGSEALRYELRRGGTDLIRSCHAETVTEEVGLPPTSQYTIRPFTIGYAPQSNEAQRASPTTFATRSGLMPSCLNGTEVVGGLTSRSECWRFFARGRSLSANGWQLRIPILIDQAYTENAWIMGNNLPRERRPIIEDIVIYLRYHSRPTSDR